MQIALVDACGGRFGATHGSIQLYEVPQSVWEENDPYSLTPDETLAVMEELVEQGEAELTETINPDDTVTV